MKPISLFMEDRQIEFRSVEENVTWEIKTFQGEMEMLEIKI